MAKNYRLARIQKNSLTVRIQRSAESYGFKTVGKFEDFLRQSRPTARIPVGMGHVRVIRLLEDIDNFKVEYEQ